MPTPPKKQPRLKNFTTELTEAQIFDLIRQSLAENKARRISFDYVEGKANSLSFHILVNGNMAEFRLPARISTVERLVKEAYSTTRLALPKRRSIEEQSYLVAWANIKDWVLAQMALVQAEMVQMEEVFLPYMIGKEDKTFFETMQEQRFLLEPPRQRTITEE